MKNFIHCLALGIAALTSHLALAAPTVATDITAEDVQTVLKAGIKATDHTIRVIDMGQGYQMSVAVIHRGSTHTAPTPEAAAAAKALRAKQAPCGVQKAPAGARVSAFGGILMHDLTPETYVIIKGTGTLVTGGHLLEARRSLPDDETVTTLNGPTCTGKVYGDFVSRVVKVGDVIVVPAGVPHGWSDVPDMVDYLSIRPDVKHVLPSGYVYPALRDKK
jgi:mannose-6-phosphate isomerase-like protein (cupin superfamily)